MANPNIVSMSSMYGNSAVQNVTTSATAVVTNSAASGKVYKVNMLVVANIDSTNSATITVDLYRANSATKLSNEVTIGINTAFTPIDKSLCLYLLEGDSLRLTSNANSRLQAICSWEEIG